MRNESAQAVRIEIVRPGGPMVWLVPTWQAGECPAAEIGLTDQGAADTLPMSSVRVSGPSVPQPTEFPGVATRIQAGGLALTVDAAGAVHVEAAQPELTPGCQAYPLKGGQ